jgi:hypothetical protein
MISKNIVTSFGYTFHVSLNKGVCCLVYYDRFTGDCKVRYFTKYRDVIKYIEKLEFP